MAAGAYDVPVELWDLLTSFADEEDVRALCSTDTRFAGICSSPNFWYTYYERRHPGNTQRIQEIEAYVSEKLGERSY